MFSNLLKIIAVLLAVFPLWLTIVAFGGSHEVDTAWKDQINAELLKFDNRRIQILEVLPTAKPLEATFLEKPFKMDISKIRSKGISTLGLKYYDDLGRLQKLIWLRVKLHIEDQVPVARRLISRGAVFDREDFSIEWRDASDFRSLPANLKTLVGRQIRNSVQPGKIIFDNQLRPLRAQVLVRRGDRIQISVNSPGIELTLAGIAKEAGAKGQTIKVMNLDSQKIFYATIINSKMAEVRF